MSLEKSVFTEETIKEYANRILEAPIAIKLLAKMVYICLKNSNQNIKNLI